MNSSLETKTVGRYSGRLLLKYLKTNKKRKRENILSMLKKYIQTECNYLSLLSLKNREASKKIRKPKIISLCFNSQMNREWMIT